MLRQAPLWAGVVEGQGHVGYQAIGMPHNLESPRILTTCVIPQLLDLGYLWLYLPSKRIELITQVRYFSSSLFGVKHPLFSLAIH